MGSYLRSIAIDHDTDDDNDDDHDLSLEEIAASLDMKVDELIMAQIVSRNLNLEGLGKVCQHSVQI